VLTDVLLQELMVPPSGLTGLGMDRTFGGTAASFPLQIHEASGTKLLLS
jgi:hypothetical protein